MFFDKISVTTFLISLAIGLFIVYVYGTDMKVIYVYPSPENINQVLYKDKADNCFTFEAREVKCPTDPAKIKVVPIQA
jgi:hypothetical protein